ncbi:hypothetical protein BJY24_004839 [Nocardia transvalensis]|uniref:Uncharacterized protein n=1 Tax=Nocardia transvalensis TaxID=37333 RepID=A0A7W9PH25_9NOCA|nr:hypothetical protein [Nocardia transvalensis]MBB5915927.1 hypothetical protein [Nocardia transvalensis]
MSGPTRLSWIGPFVGGVAAVLTAPLAAAVVAIVYRFPVPFGEYARGLEDAGTAALASVFYLMFGGVLVLAVGGTVAGWIVQRSAGTDSARVGWASLAAAFGVALVCALLLATLEFFIGPW